MVELLLQMASLLLILEEKSFTCITFKPDLAKFGMTKLDATLLQFW